MGIRAGPRKAGRGALDVAGARGHPFPQPASGRPQAEDSFMAWKKPKIVEISLALEINSYACAEIG